MKTVSDTIPQVFYNTILPEVQGNNEESAKEHAPSLHITKPAPKWPWMIVGLMITAAIAIGVGVGIWRRRRYPSHHSSTIPRCGVPMDRPSSWLTSIAPLTVTSHVLKNLFSMAHLSQL